MNLEKSHERNIYELDLGLRRSRFNTVPDMKKLLYTICFDIILPFVKEGNLFAKI